jgi:acetylornithine deacetylase
VADEEVASLGTQAICHELPGWRPDAVIVTEPTEMEIAVAHKGFVWFNIETFGVAAHGSRPQLGVDAIAKMGRVLVELEQYDLQLRANPTHPYLGSGSLHVSIIQGGQEMSSYPAYCKLQIERRTLPGESPDGVQAQLQAILDQCASTDSTFKAKLTPGLARNAFEINEDTPIVQLCRQQLTQVTDAPAKLSGVSYWADSGLFSAAGVPTLLLGPRGFGAHGPVEWVDLDSVQQSADVYTAVAQVFCR